MSGEGYRLKLVQLAPEVFVRWLKSGRIPEAVLLTEKLPEDAQLVATVVEHRAGTSQGMIILVFESQEFEPLPQGSRVIPEMESPTWGLVEASHA